MKTRPTLLLGTALASLALTVSACGGNDAKTLDPSGGTTTSGASATTDPAALEGDWHADLDALVATDTTAQQKADGVIGGDDLPATFTKLAASIKGFKITFQIQNPAVTGDTGKADVLIISDGKKFPKTYPAFWAKQGDDWRLTRAGACSLIAVSGVTCPDA